MNESRQQQREWTAGRQAETGHKKPQRQPCVPALLGAATFAPTKTLGLSLSFSCCNKAQGVIW